jgi:hypothetical protein
MFPYFKVVLVEIKLMIGLFSVFEIIEPQGNYMEELYDPGEYKLTWMLCCYFSYIAYLFYIYIYIEHAYFVTFMKYILELLGTLFCENVC